jgi:hypothetical protein
MSWRHGEEQRYSFTVLDLHALAALFPEEISRGNHWISDRPGHCRKEKKKLLPLPGIEPHFSCSSLQPNRCFPARTVNIIRVKYTYCCTLLGEHISTHISILGEKKRVLTYSFYQIGNSLMFPHCLRNSCRPENLPTISHIALVICPSPYTIKIIVLHPISHVISSVDAV